MSDLDLLETLGVIHNRKLTLAGLLLAGKAEAIREHLPGYGWTHLRMQNDTLYSDRMDGQEAIPLAIVRVLDRIMADNRTYWEWPQSSICLCQPKGKLNDR